MHLVRLLDYLRYEPRTGAEPDDLGVKTTTFRRRPYDEGLVRQVGQCNVRLVSKPMRRRQSDGETILIEWDHIEPRFVQERRKEHRDVARSFTQRHHLSGGRRFLEFKPNMRKAAPKGAYRLCQTAIHCATDIGQSEGSHTPGRRIPCCGDGYVRLFNGQPSMREQSLSGGRQSNDAVAAFQEFGSNLLFQPPDGRRERWLRHVEPLGRTMEMKLLRDGDELPELS